MTEPGRLRQDAVLAEEEHGAVVRARSLRPVVEDQEQAIGPERLSQVIVDRLVTEIDELRRRAKRGENLRLRRR